MYCDKCGAENRDEAEFCVNCGEKLQGGRPADVAVNETPSPQVPVTEADYTGQFSHAVSDRYEIIREIGRGGMAIVFLAKDKRLERNVALKLLPQEISRDKNFSERFMREARISANLSHPNIIQIHDVDNVGGFTYYSMSYIEGISLAQIIHKGGAINPKILTRLGIQISFAIQHAHEKGVIHRDIKPENILINSKRMPIVVDFGIARASSDARLSSTGMFIGTPQYMSPEQIQGGEIDNRSDIYSLGGLLYEMAVGRPAVKARDTASLMYKQVHEMPSPPHEVNGKINTALSAVIMKALAKNPDDRFQTAKELGMMLHEYSQTGKVPIEIAPEGVSQKASEDNIPVATDRDEPIEKTVIMDSSESVGMEEPDVGGDTAVLKKKKPPSAASPKKEKKIPAIIPALLTFGVVGLAALGIISLLDRRSPQQPVQPQETVQEERPQSSPDQPLRPPEDDFEVVEREVKPRQPQRVEPEPPKLPEDGIPVRDVKSRSAEMETDLRSEPVERETAPTRTIESATSAPAQPVRRPAVTERKADVMPTPEREASTPRETPTQTESSVEVQQSERNELASRETPQTTPVVPQPKPVPEPEKQPITTDTVAIRWIQLPGGTYEMGDHVGDIRSDLMCTPVHRVTVSPFEASRTEVTVSQYAAFIGDTGRPEPDNWRDQLAHPERPVVFVSWHDASAFAKWAEARLPTEAEWEYAARGGKTGERYPWGGESPQGRANIGNPWENGEGWKRYLDDAASYGSNDFGLFDMAGNVWEWTADRFGPYGGGLLINPTGAKSGSLRVIRGGAWNSTESFVRNAIRGPSNPDIKGPHIGFRIVR